MSNRDSVFLVVDDRFGVVFASLSVDEAVADLSKRALAEAARSTLGNPGSFRIKSVKLGSQGALINPTEDMSAESAAPHDDHVAAITRDVHLGRKSQEIRDEIIAKVGMMAAARTPEMQARYDAAVARERDRRDGSPRTRRASGQRTWTTAPQAPSVTLGSSTPRNIMSRQPRAGTSGKLFNVSITDAERARWGRAARAKGCESVSAYVIQVVNADAERALEIRPQRKRKRCPACNQLLHILNADGSIEPHLRLASFGGNPMLCTQQPELGKGKKR